MLLYISHFLNKKYIKMTNKEMIPKIVKINSKDKIIKRIMTNRVD